MDEARRAPGQDLGADQVAGRPRHARLLDAGHRCNRVAWCPVAEHGHRTGDVDGTVG